MIESARKMADTAEVKGEEIKRRLMGNACDDNHLHRDDHHHISSPPRNP
jgi:hypothetical protein